MPHSLLLALTVLMSVLGCGGSSSTSNVPTSTTSSPLDPVALESTFPFLERIGANSYLSSDADGCVSFHYADGEFVSDPSLVGCGWISGRPPRSPRPFTSQARVDLAQLRSQFDAIGFPLRFLDLHRGDDGSVDGVSVFASDRCRVYAFDPGGPMPEAERGESVERLNADWFVVSTCP
jgi:hypothetical protein